MDMMEYYTNRIFFDFSEDIEYAIDTISRIDKDKISALAKRVSLQAQFFVEGNADQEEEPDDEL